MRKNNHNAFIALEPLRTGAVKAFVYSQGRQMTNEEIVFEIQQGNDRKNNMLRLYNQNRGFIASIANRLKYYAEFDELMQEGFIGMIRAAELYQDGRNTNFITYAADWIKSAMYRHIAQSRGALRVPANQMNQIIKYKKFAERWEKLTGREPTEQDVAQMMEITKKQAREIMTDAAMLHNRSLDEMVQCGEGDGIVLADTIPCEVNQIDNVIDQIHAEERNAVLWGKVDGLGDSCAEILQRKYKHGETFEEIAKEMGKSRSTVIRLHNKSIRMLRRQRLDETIEGHTAIVAYKRTGLNAFLNTWTSSTEAATIARENIRQRFAEMLSTGKTATTN